jgi:hypothetical protein
LYEQEILRCFNNVSREIANQTIPLSFCTIIKDDEVYSQYKPPNEPELTTPITNAISQSHDDCVLVKTVPTQSQSSEEKFLNNLSNLKAKFYKLKVINKK